MIKTMQLQMLNEEKLITFTMYSDRKVTRELHNRHADSFFGNSLVKRMNVLCFT